MNQFINRDEAMIILKKMLSNKSLIIHSLSVAMVMEEYAKKIDENIDEFYITGLLHDADYEEYPEKHPDVIVKKLNDLGLTKIAYAISSHYSKWGNECITNLDKYLLACDEITGFIVACSKVRPNGISDLKSKSVLKNLRKNQTKFINQNISYIFSIYCVLIKRHMGIFKALEPDICGLKDLILSCSHIVNPIFSIK